MVTLGMADNQIKDYGTSRDNQAKINISQK